MASRLSGVPELTIRAWETRHSALSPARTDSNRRLYSESDVEKLILLRKLIKQGNRIGNLANLNMAALKELYIKVEGREIPETLPKNDAQIKNLHVKMLHECIEAIKHYQDKKLESLLQKASIHYSHPDLIEKIILPLIIMIGDFWKDGLVRVSHEHFGSEIICKFLNNLSDGYHIPESAPRLVVTTPDGQYHEVGLMIGASIAASLGWKVTYLGISLPPEEIAFAVKELQPMCVYLSIVYPDDDPSINTQLKKLREMVGKDINIIISGNASSGYKNMISQINALHSSSPAQFRNFLEIIRKNN